jgi:hypothetical protein
LERLFIGHYSLDLTNNSLYWHVYIKKTNLKWKLICSQMLLASTHRHMCIHTHTLTHKIIKMTFKTCIIVLRICNIQNPWSVKLNLNKQCLAPYMLRILKWSNSCKVCLTYPYLLSICFPSWSPGKGFVRSSFTLSDYSKFLQKESSYFLPIISLNREE